MPATLVLAAALVLPLLVLLRWEHREVSRSIGGVVIPDAVARSGAELVPALLPAAAVTALAALVHRGARGRLDRITGVALALAGLVTAVLACVGLAAVGPSAAGVLTVVVAAGTVGAGIVAARIPVQPAAAPRPATSRYTVEGAEAADDEWTLASDE